MQRFRGVRGGKQILAVQENKVVVITEECKISLPGCPAVLEVDNRSDKALVIY